MFSTLIPETRQFNLAVVSS